VWKFKRGENLFLGSHSGKIKDISRLDAKGERDPRIWKLQPVTPEAGFRIVYQDGNLDRFVPRWADLEKALELQSHENDNFDDNNKVNEITSVFVVPDVVGRGTDTSEGFLFGTAGDAFPYEVYLHPKTEWVVTKEWVPADYESSFLANHFEQYLKKLMDDYEKVGTLDRQNNVVTGGGTTGGPSAWVWNGMSPRRWNNINISGSEWAIATDKTGENMMETNMSLDFPFFAAINRRASPNL